MSLRDKAAKINFEGLDEESPPASSAPEAGSASTGEGGAGRPRATGVAGITDRIQLHHQVVELQAQVAEFEKAQLVVKLDPSRVKESKWRNRHELSYSTQEYAELKAEIEAAGGNVQPIKVRRAGKGRDGQDEYEIGYGRRRNRACLELGFQVSAIIEEMDDIKLFQEMERENRTRADLSPWEQGVMYKDALDSKLFASQRQMAAALNISLGALSMAVSLASLPEDVINAFPSPLELQYRWATELSQALEKDTARVITLAREISVKSPRPPAKEVFAVLVASEDGGRVAVVAHELRSGDRVVGSFTKDAKGAVNLKLKRGVLNAAGEKKLVEFVERLLR